MKKRDTLIILITVGMSILSFITFFINGYMINIALIWNLILASIPVLISGHVRKTHSKINVILIIIWIVFIPNTFYMVTDFIHLSPNVISQTSYMQVSDTNNITFWLNLFNMYACVQLGVIYGCISLLDFRKIVGKKIYLYALPVLSIIISFGIYMGRFLRLNSWEFLNVPKIFSSLVDSFDMFSLQFIILFSIFMFIVNGVALIIYQYVESYNKLA
ncbi:hypothetical protein A4S06_10070 [Erysipelotrichaceae bacterium MTC7]|nr:hypothetical protein A4S06_10070 [Erysipelotrichaceae bacterium MTC7]